jgi:RNA polymerase sigma-70 factor (ECF subfamily)
MIDALCATWSNEEWVKALRDPGCLGHEAQTALHAVLCRGLRRAFSSKTDVLNWVEDYAQESTMRILRDLPSFRGESRFTTWAMSIAVRVSYDDLRLKRWKDVSFDALVESGDQHHPAQSGDSEKGVARQQALNALYRAIDSHLTEKQRLALTAELKEMPQTEIARRLGSTRNAVYKLTHDARKTLKEVLIQEGITADVVLWAFAQHEGVSYEAR